MALEGSSTPAASRPGAGLGSDLLAGFVTSAVYTSLTYPVHRVKVLLQTQDANPRILSGKVPRYSFTASFGRLAREQGIAGLWRGNTPYLLRHVPSISLSFALKDAFRELLPRPDAHQAPWAALGANALAGAGAGAASLAAVYPFEFATVRMAADLGAGADRQFGKGVWQVWWQAVHREGLRSMYQGFGVAVASMAAYKALYFGLYDTAKERVFGQQAGAASSEAATAAAAAGGGAGASQQQQQQHHGMHLSPRHLLARTALAACTTFVAASITYPLDIIRKRLILEVGLEDKQYKGKLRHCIARIYKNEGIAGFYRFYWYDMVFRLGGGFLLVGYDVLKWLQPGPTPALAEADGETNSSYREPARDDVLQR